MSAAAAKMGVSTARNIARIVRPPAVKLVGATESHAAPQQAAFVKRATDITSPLLRWNPGATESHAVPSRMPTSFPTASL